MKGMFTTLVVYAAVVAVIGYIWLSNLAYKDYPSVFYGLHIWALFLACAAVITWGISLMFILTSEKASSSQSGSPETPGKSPEAIQYESGPESSAP